MLVDYMQSKLPMPGSACPEDRPRLAWQANPLDMDHSPYAPKISINKNNMQWWPYSSSYQLLPTAWKRDGQDCYLRVVQSYAYHFCYSHAGKSPLGGRRHDEIAFPSQKVAVADSQQRHFGKRDLYYAYPQARQPLLFWDGAVSVRKTSDSNKGWDPKNNGDNPAAAIFTYYPDKGFESPALVGPSPKVTGYYKWTRGGLCGIDFSGTEISTKGWNWGSEN